MKEMKKDVIRIIILVVMCILGGIVSCIGEPSDILPPWLGKWGSAWSLPTLAVFFSENGWEKYTDEGNTSMIMRDIKRMILYLGILFVSIYAEGYFWAIQNVTGVLFFLCVPTAAFAVMELRAYCQYKNCRRNTGYLRKTYMKQKKDKYHTLEKVLK